jgi:hypothetical protein
MSPQALFITKNYTKSKIVFYLFFVRAALLILLLKKQTIKAVQLEDLFTLTQLEMYGPSYRFGLSSLTYYIDIHNFISSHYRLTRIDRLWFFITGQSATNIALHGYQSHSEIVSASYHPFYQREWYTPTTLNSAFRPNAWSGKSLSTSQPLHPNT